MNRISFEAKLGLALIGIALIALLWYSRGDVPQTLVAPGPGATSRTPVRGRAPESGEPYAAGRLDRPRRAGGKFRERPLPTPATSGQHAAPAQPGGPEPGPLEEEELDFETLKNMALHDPDPDNRTMALWLLAGLEDQPVAPVLMQALSDKDAEVRLAAVESLSELDDPPIEALAMALDDPDPEIRFEAISVVAEIADNRVLPLIEKALHDPDEDVRSLAEGIADLDESFAPPQTPPAGAAQR